MWLQEDHEEWFSLAKNRDDGFRFDLNLL